MTSEEIKFTPEEINDQMKNNLPFFFMAPIVYFVNNKSSIEEYEKYLKFAGEMAANGWEEAKGWPSKDVARQIALNYATLGATKISISVEETEVIVTLDDYPPEDSLKAYGISQTDFDRSFAIGKPIMEYLGLQINWKREKEAIIITLKK